MIRDPDVMRPAELASAYMQRWEIETVFDESKTHQRGRRQVLRSNSRAGRAGDLGHLCCH